MFNIDVVQFHILVCFCVLNINTSPARILIAVCSDTCVSKKKKLKQYKRVMITEGKVYWVFSKRADSIDESMCEKHHDLSEGYRLW